MSDNGEVDVLSLPPYLRNDILALVEGYKTKSHLLDCLYNEVQGSINSAFYDNVLTKEQAAFLRQKYLYLEYGDVLDSGIGGVAPMKYILMHKNTTVMEFEIDEASATISEIGQVFDTARIPVGIHLSGGRPDRKHLNDWWTRRAIPASRLGIRDALEILYVPFTQMLLTKCYGLSLSDQYWVNPADMPLAWEKVNFFHNPFTADVGNALFGKAAEGAISLVSPDNTSDGWLRKKWKIIDGKRCLLKGGSDPAQQEPLNEALASSIMRRLGVSHVPYTVIWEEGLPYSVCEDFITPNTELVSAWHISRIRRRENSISPYRHFLNCCRELGIPGVVEGLDRMLTVDYLIVNEDRHLNNFGAVRNAETLEWIGLAPIFDCGTSLWFNKFTGAIRAQAKAESKPFRASHDEQIKLASDFGWLDLSALHGVTEEYAAILSASPVIDEERRSALCRALEGRIEMLDRHIHSLPAQTAELYSSDEYEEDNEDELEQ